MNHNNLKRSVAGMLAGVMTLGAVPFAGAAKDNKTDKAQIKVTQSYIDAADGKEIADSGSYLADYKDYKPQDIKDYTYKSYAEEVQEIYDSKCTQYIIGYPDKTVRMEGNLTRAEVTQAFVRLYEGEYPDAERHMSNSTFKDVKSSDWYYDALKKMYDLGIADGTTKNKFDPDLEITRAEFAKFAALFSGLDGEYEKAFSDVDKGHWAYDYINAAASKGWIDGYKDGTFHPDEKITRAEAMKFINGVVNRDISTERLEELKVENPYTDLVKSHWAYNHAMEATIKHSHEDGVDAWHSHTYNDGKYNLQIERFVNEKGKEIAKSKTKKIEASKDAKKIPAFNHVGTLKIRTYVYSGEKAKPNVEKSASTKNAKVGDKITYTVTASNDKEAVVDGKNGVFTDVLPAGVTFEYGSVTVDGKITNDFTYDEETRLLTVKVGNVKIGKSAEIKFVATVNDTAYNTTIQNMATLTFDNSDSVQDKDDGVVIADGKTSLVVEKISDMSEAKVGDTLTYTVKATNESHAEVNVRDAKFTDVIPEGLTFNANVLVDGYSAVYSYDNDTKTLSVDLGAIAPDQTKVITFNAIVNADAYGKTIYNTAVIGGSNTEDKEDTDDGVVIEDDRKADGHIGAKTVNKSTAKVGDTLTYAIKLENSNLATADWEGMTVTDIIPEGLTFTGNVKANGSTTTNYSYDAQTRTLVLTPDAIAPSESVTFEFDATVDDGQQGKHIVNTAVLDDNGEETQLPDTGVTIDEGKTIPNINKSASATEAAVGSTFTYTMEVSNGAKATATWKDVVLTDTLPTGLKLIGNVRINNETCLYRVNGQTISVQIGDILTGETVKVEFDVQVLPEAAGQKLVNTAVAESDNGKDTGTDNGVTVPEDNGTGGGNTDDAFYVEKNVDKTLVRIDSANDEDKTAVFTIPVVNNTSETRKNVVIRDVFDLSMVTPILGDNVYLDGVLTDKWSITKNGEFVLPIGNMKPNETHELKLTLKFKSEAKDKVYVNYVTATSDSGNATAKSPEIEIVGNTDPVSETHHQLFQGYANGEWRPNDQISLQEACTVAYRLMLNGNGTWLEPGTITVPNYEYAIPEEAKYFVSKGILPASAFDTTSMTSGTDYVIDYEISSKGYLRIWSDSATLNTLVNYATNKNAGFAGNITRLVFATKICDMTGRDKNPNTSGYSGNLHTYPDVSGSAVGVVTEVSHAHQYYLDKDMKEIWI